MIETFIERGTTYKLKYGELTLYETNTPCKNIQFRFDKYMITLMLTGHKTIYIGQNKFEFFPGTLFIPNKGENQTIEIPNASIQNPTKCLVLDIDPQFLENYIQELLTQDEFNWQTISKRKSKKITHFLSNDLATIACFKRLYQYQLNNQEETDELINILVLKELIIRIFRTEGRALLIENCRKNALTPELENAVLFIKANLKSKITIDELSAVSGLGKSNLFNQFKQYMNCTPVNYILKERVKLAKTVIVDYRDIKEVAYNCGFNTYEYFCKSFKKIENMTPSQYRKKVLERKLIDVK